MKNKLLTAVILIGVLIFLIIEAGRNGGDFKLYMQASADLFKGGDIYTIDYIDGYKYYYSLLFAFFVFPFTFLPPHIAQFLWLALNAFFLYRIIKIIGAWLDTSDLSAKKRIAIFVLSFLFSLEFIILNFNYEQVTICILYLAFEGLWMIFTGKKVWGAILIALGINIKLLPIVLLPYLIYRKEFKASAILIIAYCGLLILPGFVIGFARNNALLASWWSSINPLHTNHVLDVDERSFHSLSTLLTTLLINNPPDHYALPIKRNIANISIEHLTYILNALRLILISFSFYFFRTRPFADAKNNIHRFWEVSYLLLLVPLIFPHQQEYAFLFIGPAACYIIYHLMRRVDPYKNFKFKIMLVMLALSYLACNCALLLGEYIKYYEHFKVLTYGALLLIPLLALCVPRIETDRE